MLEFADLVLRRLAAELPQATLELLWADNYIARLDVIEVGTLGKDSVFESDTPGSLSVPRTRRALHGLLETSSHPLPGLVPVVSEMASGAVTVVNAERQTDWVPSGESVKQAMEIHAMSPWRDTVLSVSALPGSRCQATLEEVLVALSGDKPDEGRGVPAPTAFLVFADVTQFVDLDRLRAGGQAAAVVRYLDEGLGEAAGSGSRSPSPRSLPRADPVSVGPDDFVLVDHLP
jgi:hypothetical protein